MKPVDQTIFVDPGGNCMSACLASLLELTLADVPNFSPKAKEPGAWHAAIQEWLETRGFEALFFPIEAGPVSRGERIGTWTFEARSHVPKAYYVLGGVTPRGGNHSVVARGTEIVFDPDPCFREGLATIDSGACLMPLDPAAVMPHGASKESMARLRTIINQQMERDLQKIQAVLAKAIEDDMLRITEQKR